MASAPPAGALSLHTHTCLMDEHDRMLFQHSDPTVIDTERTAFKTGSEGLSASLPETIWRKSNALHLDKRAGTPAKNHRGNQRISGRSSQTAKAANSQR